MIPRRLLGEWLRCLGQANHRGPWPYRTVRASFTYYGHEQNDPRAVSDSRGSDRRSLSDESKE